MRRPADIGGVLDGVGCRIDEGDGVRPDRDNDNGAVVGREAHAMHQDLPIVERAEIRRLRLPQPNDPEQRVVGRVGDRHRVGELLGGIDTVLVAHWDIGRGSRRGSLSSPGGRAARQHSAAQQSSDE